MKNRFIIGILMFALIITMFPATQSSAESKKALEQESDKKDYQVSFRKVDSWEGHINGEITIKNIGDSMIKDWQLEMDFDGKIESIWNASVVSNDDKIVLSNGGWNKDIVVGDEVSCGFIATVGDENVEPNNFFVYTEKSDNNTDNFENITAQDTIQRYYRDINEENYDDISVICILGR